MSIMGGLFSNRQIATRFRRKEQAGRFLRGIRNWHLVLVLIPLGFLTATMLRIDHLRMNDLLTAVVQADAEELSFEEPSEDADARAGEIDANIARALYELKSFTEHHIVLNVVEENGVSHLEFGTGPFYLENQYNRKAAAAISEAEKKAAELPDANPNGNVFAKALEVCQPKAIANGWRWNSTEYMNCYYDVIYSFPTTDELVSSVIAEIPTTALFRYDFVSPVWAPCVSGWLLLACVVMLVVIIVRAVCWIILQIALRIVK